MDSLQSEISDHLFKNLAVAHTQATEPLELDSLTILLLVTFLESTHSVGFEATDITHTNFSSVERIARLVRSKLSQRN